MAEHDRKILRVIGCEYDGSELQYFGLRDLIHEIDDMLYSAIASIRTALARIRVSRGGGVAADSEYRGMIHGAAASWKISIFYKE